MEYSNVAHAYLHESRERTCVVSVGESRRDLETGSQRSAQLQVVMVIEEVGWGEGIW